MALEETPDSTNGGTPGADATDDWHKRYSDLQSEYTRSQQENAKLRQYQQWADALQGDDPQAAQEAADNLGLSFVNDDEPEYDDPYEKLAHEVEQLKQHLGSREQQEQQAAREAQDLEVLDRGLGSFEQRIGRKLEQGEVQLLVSHAVVNRDENGAPGIDAAIGLYDGLDKNSQSRWVNTKRVSVPSVGQEGEEAPALDTHAERVADMTAKFLANER